MSTEPDPIKATWPDPVVTVHPIAAVTTSKARGAAGGGVAGLLAGMIVSRLPGVDLTETEALILGGALASALAYAGAYLRQIGPVVVRKLGLPTPDDLE